MDHSVEMRARDLQLPFYVFPRPIMQLVPYCQSGCCRVAYVAIVVCHVLFIFRAIYFSQTHMK